jgi:hypothetical protein
MGTQLANGGNIRIRFCYRGISPDPATEIWRKREDMLRIVRVKGPRFSSFTLVHPLSYATLSPSRRLLMNRFDKKWETMRSRISHELQNVQVNVTGSGLDDSILNRVGMDQGVHVSADSIVVLMAVANETNSTIILSNQKGRVGGFQGPPMPTVTVTSDVSVEIPVVIPRISRIEEK